MSTSKEIILRLPPSLSAKYPPTGMKISNIKEYPHSGLAVTKYTGMSKTTGQQVRPSIHAAFNHVLNIECLSGNGVTDDTAAINAAINDGNRCGRGCASSTTTPAVVYFPAGTYLISSSIIDQYNTQLIGNPNDLPVLKATASFSGFGLIDGDVYYTENLNWGSTNVFYRQVRNFILDTTNIPAGSAATGIHWPTAQATSLQNLVFQMSSASGTKHVGLFCESGTSKLARKWKK